MSASPTIRSVAREDFAQWLPLWDGYNTFYGRSGATALPAEVTQMTWARFFDAYEPMHALVAESSGQLVGLAHYIFHRSTLLLGPSCASFITIPLSAHISDRNHFPLLAFIFSAAPASPCGNNAPSTASIADMFEPPRSAPAIRSNEFAHAPRQSARKMLWLRRAFARIFSQLLGGLHHGAPEASFEAKGSEDNVTGGWGRRRVLGDGRRRISNCADNESAVARPRTSSCDHSR